VEHTRDGPLLLVRMDPGEDLLATLLQAMEEQGVSSVVVVSGIGAVDGVEVGYFDPASRQYERAKLEGSHELVSVSGTVGWDAAQGFQPHVHVALGGRDHVVRGGHLFRATVSVTAEVAARVVPEGVVRREPAPDAGPAKMRFGKAR